MEGPGYCGDVGAPRRGGRRMSNPHSGGLTGLGGGGKSGGGSHGGGGGGVRGGRTSRRASRRGLMHRESTVVVPAIVERWPIE